MSETRKIAAILVSDVVGYSRLAGADEDRTLARLRSLRSDLIDPTISVHHGRVVKRTGDGSIIEFRSVVEAVRCAIEVQNGLVERNAGVPPERRIEFRVGIHLGDVVEESDGDLMGDGVNIAARLEGIAAPGAICLSEDAYRQVKGRVDLAVSDLGPTQLKNIAEPIRIYSMQVGVPAGAKPAQPLASKNQPRLALLIIGLAALVVFGAGAWYFAGRSKSPALEAQQSAASLASGEPARPIPRLSIVVLPFANLSNDPDQDYFADGITENLTTDLSRLSGSFVIARNTAFTFKGKNVDAKEIGKELGVRSVLEGSVQRDQSRIRVNAQLIDAASGGHLWAERFDKPLADLFGMQDEIVASLASQLGAELVANEARRAERAPNPDAMDLYFQGLARFNKGTTPEYLAQARGFFERALALDPDNLDALIGTASVGHQMVANYVADDRAALLAAMEAMLTKVLSLAPGNALAHLRMGNVPVNTNRGAQAMAEFERALALNPNLADAHAYIGFALLVNGHAEETESHVLEALRLSPRDTNAYIWLGFIAASKLYIGADEEAVALYRRANEINPNRPVSHVFLAAALAELGRLDEARDEVRAALALNPKLTIRRIQAGTQSDNPIFLKQRERLIEGMRRAGIPEGGPPPANSP